MESKRTRVECSLERNSLFTTDITNCTGIVVTIHPFSENSWTFADCFPSWSRGWWFEFISTDIVRHLAITIFIFIFLLVFVVLIFVLILIIAWLFFFLRFRNRFIVVTEKNTSEWRDVDCVVELPLDDLRLSLNGHSRSRFSRRDSQPVLFHSIDDLLTNFSLLVSASPV